MYGIDSSIWHQIGQARERLQSAVGLPFSHLLAAELVSQALAETGLAFRDRIFNPLTTLWMFLSQVLCADGSCRQAVARLLAWRVAGGLPPCSADSSSEAAFPHSTNQRPGVGFPIARLVVIFSLATAAAIDMALGPTKGKKTGENTLFRTLWDNFQPSDIVLGDRLFDSDRDIAQLRERSVDVLFRMKQSRRCDFRRGRWLGTLDHVVVWKKPRFKPARIDRATYDALPDQMEVRELRFRVEQNGFRPNEIVLVTTLLDTQLYSKDELAELYRERWHCELDLRALKTTLGMDRVRCFTPEMVEKELWIHLLAYNLIRQTIVVSSRHDLLPRRVSFQGARQILESFAPYLALWTLPDPLHLWETMLTAIATHHVGDRPNRVEPRKIKRRSDRYTHLTHPRTEERRRLLA